MNFRTIPDPQIHNSSLYQFFYLSVMMPPPRLSFSGFIRTLVISFLVFNGSLFNSFAQLSTFQDEEGVISPTFRHDILREKKIASILIQDEVKPDGKKIHDDGIIQYYRFDTATRLTESYYTIKTESNAWDTIRTRYYYNGNNQPVTKRTNQGVFFDTWYYTWYQNGLIKKEAHVHETQAPAEGTSFYVGAQKVISCDSFAYNTYPKQIQRYGYNEENTIYEKTITQFDDHRNMIGRYSHYQVGWLYSQVDLKYDSANRLIEYTYSGNVNGEVHKTTRILYDKSGNISSEKIFEKEKQTHEVEFIYDNNTGLISDKLDRDYDKGLIEIRKFTYTFFDTDIILDSQ